MLDRQFISELKNEMNVKHPAELTEYDRRILAIGLFKQGSIIQQLSAIETARPTFDIIDALPAYAEKTLNDNEKINLALKIADSLVKNIVNYHEEEIEGYFL